MAEFDEKDFITPQEKSPYPIWIWLFLLVVFLGLIWQVAIWYTQGETETAPAGAFYQVTNREMSVFLWQNPSLMRANSPNKIRYLPGFDTSDQIAVVLTKADKLAIGPPDLFFRYHTWKRLLVNEFSNTPVNNADFRAFLEYAPEWLPVNWPGAPKRYREQINSGDFQNLPLEVRIAFQGWRNLFKEEEQIRNTNPTYDEMEQFLKAKPHYARNFWRNIAGHDYLYTLTRETFKPEDAIPPQEILPFLRQAFFNYKQATG